MARVTDRLLVEPLGETTADLSAFLADWRTRTGALPDRSPDPTRPFQGALIGGLMAHSLGQAFAGGYVSATEALVGDRARGRALALAATESGGGHPRSIQTRLERQTDGTVLIEGEKSFVTMADQADGIVVIARRGEKPDGRPDLAAVIVEIEAPGVRLLELQRTPFAPELAHARVVFEKTPVAPEGVLPGDGYADFLKPFRTVEDAHVLGAALAYVTRMARLFGFSNHAIARLVLAGEALGRVAEGDPREPHTHLLLAGAIDSLTIPFDPTTEDWQRVPNADRERFERDAPLFQIAGRARAKRLERAIQALGVRTTT